MLSRAWSSSRFKVSSSCLGRCFLPTLAVPAQPADRSASRGTGTRPGYQRAAHPPHDRLTAAHNPWHPGDQRSHGRHGLAGQHLRAESSARELTNCHSTGLTFHNRLLWSKLPFCILLTVKAREVLASKRFGPQNVQERLTCD